MPDPSPFLAPAWLLAWADIYAPDRCRAAALWADGKLAGLLPTFVWESALLLAGTGPSDHGGVLIRPGFEKWAGTLVEAAAEAAPEPFERIDLQQLAPGSPLIDCAVPGWSARMEEGDCCPALMLAGRDGMANAPKRMRSNWRYAMRQLDRKGGAVERVAAAEIHETMAALERLHGLRWTEKGEAGMLADPLPSRFLRTVAPALAEAGLLQLHRLRLDGGTIAVLLAMQTEGESCYFLSGFDPDHAGLSPGTILVGGAIAEAARNGATRFDFLRGKEPYKYRWGAKDRSLYRHILTRSC
ncbi:GNAT family N-acetyltransferase [Sphingomonas oleivorans]|uniref:GNAT family N-acetyltransferase n=1 Tax=Sphingomonas oleivorans TaxID=1735121 RepID=UPI0013FD4C38|nr:GNAT family N-acetyltransferase [Sphingomonas oleivorans]